MVTGHQKKAIINYFLHAPSFLPENPLPAKELFARDIIVFILYHVRQNLVTH